ncbi:MAG TPA: GGDEF domain-containing phosphodiesterase, partial [Pseudomonadales bacterium]|nr:GGDEF domain-containing phosphodiesterase [Pseudomonadales bacterium]
ENGSYKIGASIGICIVDGETSSAGEILKRADSAMYAAKRLGGNSFSFYDPSIQEEIDRKLQIEREIIGAIEQRQFCAYFQPQIDTRGNVVGAEALIRWVHPVRGLISPASFIPIAENSGLIFQLQNIVLEDSCRLLNELKKQHGVPEDFAISVNISSNQFKTGKLDENLLKVMKQFGVTPQSIILEITESLLMQNKNEAVSQMQRLKKLGFRFSVDDFGTGYSSLAYLHALPLDELKIDKTFVDQISMHDSGTAIIDSIISLAGHLRLHVVAEGVETAAQFEVLAQRPIQAVQGYLFSKPLPRDEFKRWVANSSEARHLQAQRAVHTPV